MFRTPVGSRFTISNFSGRTGFTVLELLVCVAIAALLISLLGAAVISARESARRMQCLSHIKQIGLATHNYESTHGFLPCSGKLGFRYLADGLEGRPGNWLAANFIDECLNGPCPEVGDWKRPPVYLCPTDPVAADTRRAVSYRFCAGLWNVLGGQGVSDGIGRADLFPGEKSGFRDVSDGLSTTAMASEQLLPPIATCRSSDELFESLVPSVVARSPLRYYWEIPTAFTMPTGLDALISSCDSQFTIPQHNTGGVWFNERVVSYDHSRTPNTRACYNATQRGNMLRFGPLSPPTSLHRGGVNVLMCDGSAHFVSDSVDSVVWRATGTRTGGESQTLSW